MPQRAVLPQLRTFFWGAGTALSGIAGLVLFLQPDRTEKLFAWTLLRGDTAAFLGACFLAISLLSLLCYSVPAWSGVRLYFVGTLIYVTAMAVATLLHLDQFHYGSDEPLALVSAWAWTIVYVVAPVAAGVMLSRQRKAPGTDRPPGTPIVPGLRYLYLAQGAVLAMIGLVLFVSPGTADTLWPWPLTPLPARAIASFLLGFGIMLAGAGWENAAERLEPICAPAWWLAVLTGMAVVRYDGSVDIGTVPGLVFAVIAASLLVGGLAGEMAARRLRPPPLAPPTPPTPPAPPPQAAPPAPPAAPRDGRGRRRLTD